MTLLAPTVRDEIKPIKCLWCNYTDPIEFDLSLHMLDRHRDKLLQLSIYSNYRKRTKALSGDFFARFEGAIEFRLDIAVEMAIDENRVKGIRHAVRILQKRIIERRREKKLRGEVDITLHYQRLPEIVDTEPELVRNGECDISNCVCHWVGTLKLNKAESN